MFGRICVAATATALVCAGPASAAYAPQFSISVSPATPSSAAAITSTITQADGETPSKTVTVVLPPGFTPSGYNTLGVCSTFEEAAGTCPAASQMGNASATIVAFGLVRMLSGPVYFGGPAATPGSFRLIAVLVDPALGPQTLDGTSTLRSDGSVATVFDNLPNFLATAFTLALDGGTRALLTTPAACGTYPVTAAFVSQTGEQASGSAPVTIGGCLATTGAAPSAPAVAPGELLRVGAARLTRAGVASFTLSAPAKVTVTVTRAGRRVGRRTVAGHAGANRAKVARRLRAGRYVVSLSAVDAAGRTVTRRTTLRVR